MTVVAHRLSTSKSTDAYSRYYINPTSRIYEVHMRINTDRKSQRTTVGQKARQADHLAWSEDPPFLRELYSLFPKVFTCELTRIENPNEQQLGRKPARHDHLAWSEDPPFLRELYSLFPKFLCIRFIEIFT
ncbi:hypothetical protein SFRURICE_013439 [Spodoptera frugiperda]|nr:hypothetical protein SFRURICE_013439 [Spodoptera frugiperda]